MLVRNQFQFDSSQVIQNQQQNHPDKIHLYTKHPSLHNHISFLLHLKAISNNCEKPIGLRSNTYKFISKLLKF